MYPSSSKDGGDKEVTLLKEEDDEDGEDRVFFLFFLYDFLVILPLNYLSLLLDTTHCFLYLLIAGFCQSIVLFLGCFILVYQCYMNQYHFEIWYRYIHNVVGILK